MRVLEKITKGITDVLGVIAGVMITVMMLLAVLASLAKGSYNPFIYFNF